MAKPTLEDLASASASMSGIHGTEVVFKRVADPSLLGCQRLLSEGGAAAEVAAGAAPESFSQVAREDVPSSQGSCHQKSEGGTVSPEVTTACNDNSLATGPFYLAMCKSFFDQPKLQRPNNQEKFAVPGWMLGLRLCLSRLSPGSRFINYRCVSWG